MEDTIRKLRAEREMLQERLSRIDAAIDGYDRWSRDVAGLLGDNVAPIAAAGSSEETSLTPIAEFEAAVRDLFGRVSAPLKRTEVYEQLTKAGVVVGGKEPLNTVASRLSRMDGITNLKGHGYWLEDRPYPPAGHPPNSGPAGFLFTEAEQGEASGSASRESMGGTEPVERGTTSREGLPDAD